MLLTQQPRLLQANRVPPSTDSTFSRSMSKHFRTGRNAPRKCTRVAQSEATGEVSQSSAQQLLACISDLAPGQEPDKEQQERIDALIQDIEDAQLPERRRPLENPLIFGNYSVAYVGTSQSTVKNDQPAGGRFREGFGKFLFRTTELCQSVMEPNVVTNKLAFLFLGFLPGSVGLRGAFEAVGDLADTVKVNFEPPQVSLGGNIHLAIGPASSVVLTTTYLDESLRLGRGSRGNRFVFKRGGYADNVGMEHIGLKRNTPIGWLLLILGIAGLISGTFALAKSTSIISKVLAVLVGLLTAAVVTVCYRGGQR